MRFGKPVQEQERPAVTHAADEDRRLTRLNDRGFKPIEHVTLHCHIPPSSFVIPIGTITRSLDDVDDYAWTDRTTLRWRSRRSSDPPFADTAIRYELRYELAGILLKDRDGYTLDHDFAFRDRDGTIERFVLRLTLDSAWQPVSDVRTVYTAGPLPPGETFVLSLPLRYTGAGAPATLDLSPPREIVIGVWFLLGATSVALLWFFVREQSYGRFAPLAEHIDEPWLREHILKYPAEVVGAAWDEGIGTPEVVSLIARMVSEGKLESHVGKENEKRWRLVTAAINPRARLD